MFKAKYIFLLLLLWLLLPNSSLFSQAIPMPVKNKNGTTVSRGNKKSNKSQHLQDEIAEMNKSLPLGIGTGMTMSKYSFDGRNLVLKMLCDENVVSIDLFNQRKNQMHEALVIGYRNNDDISVLSLFELLTNNNAGLEVRYVGNTTGKVCSVILTPSEVRDIVSVDNSDKSPRAVVEQLIKSENENYPAVVDDGLILIGGVVEDFYVVYEASVDEEIYSISNMNHNKDELKMNILSAFDDGSLETKNFCNNLIEARLGVEYRYIGDVTGEICEVKISVAELKEMIDSIVAE